MLTLLTGDTANFSIDRTGAERRPLQSEAFSEMTELLGQTAAFAWSARPARVRPANPKRR